MPSALERVRESYPTLAFLLNDPEMGSLLRDATDPNRGFSPQRFQAEMMETSWYKRRSQAQRQYSILRNADPGEFKQRIRNFSHAVRMEAKTLGVRLTNKEVAWLAHEALQKGYDPTDPRIALGISQIRRKNPSRTQYGAIRQAARDTRALAHREYMIPMSKSTMWRWADDMARGLKDEGALRTYLSNQAEKRYPHLRSQLRAGHTMNDLFGGHIETVAETLELNPADIQPWKSNSKWRPITAITDRKSGKARAMTMAEAETFARADGRYWKTSAGKQQDAGMAQFMAQTFGKRA